MAASHNRNVGASAGFTLIEVLVALAIMAVLTGLAWRGIDGMLRARDGSQQAVDRTARLNTILTQWAQDLDAVVDSGAAPALAYNGQTLLLTRRLDGGVALVAWAVRTGSWQRWVSPVLTRAPAVQEAWLRAQQLLGTEPEQLKLLDGVTDWQVYFYRGNAWTNPQSTGNVVTVPVVAAQAAASQASGAGQGGAASGPGGAASAPPTITVTQTREQLPTGVRVVINIGGQVLTRDIALGPH